MSVNNATRLYTSYITKEQLFTLLHEIRFQYNFKKKKHVDVPYHYLLWHKLPFYYNTVTHDQQSVTNILVSASTNVITSEMQYLKLFSLDEGGSRFLQNIWSSVPIYTAATFVPLYQTTIPSHLSLCTRLSYHHICPSVPHYNAITYVPLYQTILPSHLSLCTTLQQHHVCPSVPDYPTITCPPVPDYPTITTVPLYNTTLPSHLSLCTRLPLTLYLPLCTKLHCCHICSSIPTYTTIMSQNI